MSRGGVAWRPAFQREPTIAIGALWVNTRDHSLWAGTGEANGDFVGYPGDGV